MANTPKSLADGQLPSSKGTLYTVPASTKTLIKSIIIVNIGAVSRTVNIYAKPNSTSRRIFPKDYALASSAQVELETSLILEAGDLIEGDAAAANEIDFVISGVEIT
jgi:hypothetical protein